MTHEAGTVIGQYRLANKIGEGGMGAVYLAHHTLIGRPAAIKVLLPALSAQREVVDRFFNEARATTAFNDPGIVQVFDFGFHTDNSAYIVMELLDGESLEHRLRRGTLGLADALRITRQAAGSLAAAHAGGVVHRDLKPDNLFLVRDPEAQGGERTKILDFGIAKLATSPDRMRTATGMLMGTPVYMSPEQCRGAGSVDHRSDIYSLGCVLYQILTGRPPFDYEGVGEIISAHMNNPPRPPSVANPNIPPGVDSLVLCCLAKSPDERFQSMTALQGACEAQLARITGAGAGMSINIVAAYPAPTRPGTPTTLSAAAGAGVGTMPPVARSRRGLWFALAGLIVGGVAVTVVAMRTGGGNPQPAEPPPAATQPAPTPAPPPPPPAPPPVTPAVVAPPPVDAGVVIDAPVDAAPAKKPGKIAPKRTPQDDPYDLR